MAENERKITKAFITEAGGIMKRRSLSGTEETIRVVCRTPTKEVVK